MELSSEIQLLLERFVKGFTSEEENSKVQELVATNTAVAETLATMQMLRTSFIEEELANAKSLFQGLEEQIAKQEATAAPSLTQKIKTTITEDIDKAIRFTSEQLQKLFAPISVYEKQISKVALRASSPSLVHPKIGLDCQNHQLYFELASPIDDEEEEIEVIIENNLQEELLAEEYDATLNSFTISLNPTTFTTGRYYWKFTIGEHTILGNFFIDKHLMPEA